MFELIFNAVLAVILLAFLILGIQIPMRSNPADFVEAKGFPIIFSIIALLLLLWETIAQIRALKKNPDREKDPAAFEKKNAPKLIAVILMTILYIILVNTAGFVLLTFFYVFAALNILGSRRQLFNLIFSLCAVAALVLIFGRFFGVTLPRGAGFLRQISFYLY